MYNVINKRRRDLEEAKKARPAPPMPPEKEGPPAPKAEATLEPEGVVSPKGPGTEKFGGMHHRKAAEHHQKLADHFKKIASAHKPEQPSGGEDYGDGIDLGHDGY